MITLQTYADIKQFAYGEHTRLGIFLLGLFCEKYANSTGDSKVFIYSAIQLKEIFNGNLLVIEDNNELESLELNDSYSSEHHESFIVKFISSDKYASFGDRSEIKSDLYIIPRDLILLRAMHSTLLKVINIKDGVDESNTLELDSGICSNIINAYYYNYDNTLWGHVITNNTLTWKHFSGSYPYPVPHGTMTARDAYYTCENLYINEYGELRIDLAKHLLPFVEDALNTYKLDRNNFFLSHAKRQSLYNQPTINRT